MWLVSEWQWARCRFACVAIVVDRQTERPTKTPRPLASLGERRVHIPRKACSPLDRTKARRFNKRDGKDKQTSSSFRADDFRRSTLYFGKVNNTSCPRTTRPVVLQKGSWRGSCLRDICESTNYLQFLQGNNLGRLPQDLGSTELSLC